MALNANFWIVLVLVLGLYFIWMDVVLYYRLQSDRESLLITQNYKLLKNPEAQLSQASAAFDPFDPISVKLLTLDHINHYIYYPLTGWLDGDVLQISEQWIFITSDMISFSHVGVALVAAKFLNSESLFQRRIGVLLFEIRSFLDSYVGFVARARMHKRGMAQIWGSWGYYLQMLMLLLYYQRPAAVSGTINTWKFYEQDGICNLIGTTFFMLVILFTLKKKNLPRKFFQLPKFVVRYEEKLRSWFQFIRNGQKRDADDDVDVEKLLPSMMTSRPISPTSAITPCTPVTYTQGHLIICQCWAMALCVSLQQFISSVFWNCYMQQYHILLEIPHSTENQDAVLKFQTETLQSAPFWIIVWLRRLLNPHAQMSFLLRAIFFDKTLEVFRWIQFLQFVPLVALVFTSEVHLQATAWNVPG